MRMLVQRSTRETVLRLGVWAVSLDDGSVARLLAGLEVALAQALRETKCGKCLKCGSTDTPWSALRAREPCVAVRCYCGGVLAPVKGRQP